MTDADQEVAPGSAAGGRLENPQDVQFAVHALLGCLSPEDADCAAGRGAVLAALPPGPTVSEVVDAVLAWRRRGERPEDEERRLARWLLATYFHLDPPLQAEAPGEMQ